MYLSVRAESAGAVSTASRVSLEPLSSDDWEILEANAEYLEGELLSQVGEEEEEGGWRRAGQDVEGDFFRF